MTQFLNLAIARLFYPETFPRTPFAHSKACGVLVAGLYLAVITALVLS